MADYAKKKNDELATLCKERGLAHTGKKADLVKRLEDHDASNGAAPATAAVDDEIDWDDEPPTETAKAATTQPAADALAAGGIGEVSNPQDVPNQVAAVDPAQTDELTVDPPAPVAEEKDFTSGLAERTLDEEIEKRKARARKFGMPEDSDEIKALERAKKFGTGDLPGLLNKALPARAGKRGRDSENDGGIRKGGRGSHRGRPGVGGRRDSGRRERTPQAAGNPGWMSKEDRDAAERRRAKFATAS